MALAFDPARFSLKLEQVLTGLNQPVHVTGAGDGSGRLFAVEKAGRILILRGGQLDSTPFLDIRGLVGSRGSEQGLLSVAFHPRYAETGWLYVNYTNREGHTVVARYSVSQDANRADPASAAVLLEVRQPAPNHNGGYLLFGPDGYLYIGLGDGGGRADQFRNAQNMQVLLGKMLRVDVDAAFPYGVPADNPFVGVADARAEIWAYGLRNPWRYAFDRVTGDLFIADVGQDRYEEVHLQPSGAGGQNYGWPAMEGAHCFPETVQCDRSGLDLPVAEYSHELGCSITGGPVYRGRAYPEAQGVYLYGDFCSGRIWALHQTADGAWSTTQMLQDRRSISSFGEDDEGEVYVVTLDPGALYRVRFEPR